MNSRRISATPAGMHGTPALAKHAANLIGDELVEATPLHGGDLAEVQRLRLASGRVVVAKSGPFPPREGRMLEAMARAGAEVPGVIASDARVLVIEDLGPTAPAPDAAWERLGRSLARMHAATGKKFGWDEDYAFGAVAIRNAPADDWQAFWFENRVMPGAASLPGDLARQLESLWPRIADIAPSRPPASLLHGDLWSGNAHFTRAGAFMIDPACYHGHAEVDLAMLTLFGSPPPAFFGAYGPLEPGWQMRRHLYQLWPALVHLRLFGAGYRGLVEGLIARLGA